MQPLVSIGARLSRQTDGKTPGIGASLLLGIATGLLWAPCAGPVLGLILTGAALGGASAHTTLLLLAYAAGAATSLALALLVGGRVFAAMKRSLGAGEWVRRGLGAAVLVAVVAIALGVETGFLTRISATSTASLEQGLLERLRTPMPSTQAAEPKISLAALHVEGDAPSLDGATAWLNSEPLTTAQLKGKVVLIDFWTYSCINCIRTLPYVKAWAEKYRDQGLVVIGVHAPEFAFEKNLGNVKKAVADFGITYPVAIDNDYAIWRAFSNQYWPAHYFVDAQGRVRYHHFGEGDYDGSERVIQQLLAEAGAKVDAGLVNVDGTGAFAAAAEAEVGSPETYVGYARAERFASPGGAMRDAQQTYGTGDLGLNAWGLSGAWTIRREHAALDQPGGGIAYRFHARDLHLVLGPGADGKPVHFQVRVDGNLPGASHGADVDADGNGVVTSQRLYQLVREAGAVRDRTFEIRFAESGVQAYAFTFG